MMSPFSSLMAFRPDAKQSGEKAVKPMPVVPAGRATVRSTPWVNPNLELRLLYAGRDPAGGLRYELSRRKLVGDLGDGLLMPVGNVLAGLWDRRNERYVALSRPFQIAPRTTVVAPLERPHSKVAHLVVYVDRPGGTVASDGKDLALTLTVDGRTRPPELAIATSWGLYSVWYELQPGVGVLEGGNERLALSPVTVKLPPGQIARFQSKLSKRPGSQVDRD